MLVLSPGAYHWMIFKYLKKSLRFSLLSRKILLSLHTWEQSHYKEVPRWGVSNGARHNWKCFLAFKKFKVFFLNFIYFWYIKMCHKLYHFIWGIWWFHRSKDFEAMKAEEVGHSAQIQPKSQFLFHKNLPPRDFSIMTLVMAIYFKVKDVTVNQSSSKKPTKKFHIFLP